MPRQERSAGFVICYLPAGAPLISTDVAEFLLLDYGRHWDFPKGHVEPGETDVKAAWRELREETAIVNATIIPNFHEQVTYFFRHKRHGLVRKTVVFYLACVTSRSVTLSAEHTGFEFLPYERAVKRLTFATARQVLVKAWEHLGGLKDETVHRPATAVPPAGGYAEEPGPPPVTPP